MQVFLGHFYLVMNNFKGFFTFIAFVWLWGCGIWAICCGINTEEIAWLGLLLSAWALPVWMLLRYMWPSRYRGDLRETPAFAVLLVGLALALLTDTEKGLALYLAIYNLFVVLVYLFHLSALAQPQLPDVNFPSLRTATGPWRAQQAAAEGGCRGLVLVFLRGSYCADSRRLLAELARLQDEFAQRGVRLVLISSECNESTSGAVRWQRWWPRAARGEWLQVDNAGANSTFVAAAGAPLWARLLLGAKAAACRPSTWLLDCDGTILWRYLPGNYRLPGDMEGLRSQLFRLEGDET